MNLRTILASVMLLSPGSINPSSQRPADASESTPAAPTQSSTTDTVQWSIGLLSLYYSVHYFSTGMQFLDRARQARDASFITRALNYLLPKNQEEIPQDIAHQAHEHLKQHLTEEHSALAVSIGSFAVSGLMMFGAFSAIRCAQTQKPQGTAAAAINTISVIASTISHYRH